jgi:hypothetical protein
MQTTLPLNTLGVDPMNVRSIGRGDSDPELKASIKTKGVKQPLIVREGGPGHVAYVGGRRLEQLQALAMKRRHSPSSKPAARMRTPDGMRSVRRSRSSRCAARHHRAPLVRPQAESRNRLLRRHGE